LILATAPEAKSISSMVAGLAETGKLLVVGVPHESISVNVIEIVGQKLAVQGWPSGSAIDSEDTLRFRALNGVQPMIEKYPLEKVGEAYHQMISGRVRFHVVLAMGK